MNKSLLWLIFLSFLTFSRPFTSNFTEFLTGQHAVNDYVVYVGENDYYIPNGTAYYINGTECVLRWWTPYYERVKNLFPISENVYLLHYAREPPYRDNILRLVNRSCGTLSEFSTDTYSWPSVSDVSNNYFVAYMREGNPRHFVTVPIAGGTFGTYKHYDIPQDGDADVGVIRGVGAVMIVADNKVHAYVENSTRENAIYLGNYTLPAAYATGKTRNGGIACGGSPTQFSCLVALVTGDIYRCDVMSYLTAGGSQLVYQFVGCYPYSSNYVSFDCETWETPICANVFQGYEDYIWFHLLKWEGYDASAGRLSTSAPDKLALEVVNEMVYAVSKSVSNLHYGLYDNSSNFQVYYPIYITAYLSNQNLAETGRYSCGGENGYVCLTDDRNEIYMIPTLNLNEGAGYLPPGQYYVSFYNQQGQYVECSMPVFVNTEDPMVNNRYVIYVDTSTCQSGEPQYQYAIENYGKYGVLNMMNGDEIYFNVRERNLRRLVYGLNCSLQLTNGLENHTFAASPTIKMGLEDPYSLDYNYRIAISGLDTGPWAGYLSCEGILGHKYMTINIVEATGVEPASVTLKQGNLESMKVNLVKIQFLEDGNFISGARCLATNEYGHTYNMYESIPPNCDRIANLTGGGECYECESDSERCFYYAVVDASQLIYVPQTVEWQFQCWDETFFGDSEANITQQTLLYYPASLKVVDYKGEETTTLVFTNDSSKDTFKVLGFIYNSTSNYTNVFPAGTTCYVEYETCDAIGEEKFQKNVRRVALSPANTPWGIGFISSSLPTNNLCNGRALTDMYGNFMDTKGQIVLKCSTPNALIGQPHVTYTGAVLITPVGGMTGLGGGTGAIGASITKIFSDAFDVLYFVGGLFVKVALSHMLETIILIGLIILFAPLALKLQGW